MQYVLLLYENDQEREAKSAEEVGACLAYVDAMHKAGILRGGERLRPAASATTVRVGDRGVRVMDGPYAEVKEQLGGFHIIDVKDLDEALRWASRCPTTQRGVVEVRPIWPVD